jgi:hypothetical protein
LPNKEKGRLSCRIDASLLAWVRWFAKQNDTTVTRLVVDYFKTLRARHQAQYDVEQL